MFRTPPTVSIPTLNFQPPKSFIVNLQTITPMFGGSASTREVDTEHPVRAASVRGQLRFWWRATAGAQYQSAEKLFEEESKIWGNTKKPGVVRVEILNQKADPPRVPQLARELTYATFPFQEQRASPTSLGVAAGKATSASFILCLTCSPDHLPQVKTAVQAWVMFGGIGSRTRRGCGSLRVTDGVLPPLTFSGKGAQMLTTLPGVFYQGKVENDPLRTWEQAVRVYKEFRQQRNAGQERNRPGRSHWPEPDSLRRMTRRAAPNHEPSHTVTGYPRADLGLPIIFHFKDRGDPSDQTLQGSTKGQERFASPVITKAQAVAGGYAPIIMILDAPHVWEGGGVGFRKGDDLSRQQLELTPAERHDVRPLSGKPIREALADFVQQSGFSEVKL